MENLHFDQNIPRWVTHFEKQAKSGLSSRSSFNNRIIIVQRKNKSMIEEKISSKKGELKGNISEIVSPVQQVVQQAEEEIKREEEEEEDKTGERKGQSRVKYVDRKPTIKRKRVVSGRVKSKRFRDIFSK
jgi:hypothetical protein